MTPEEIEIVLYKIDVEGLDYTFVDYSDWADIEDERFQHRVKEYRRAAKELMDYIYSQQAES